MGFSSRILPQRLSRKGVGYKCIRNGRLPLGRRYSLNCMETCRCRVMLGNITAAAYE
ncbi:hypothetical protein [Vibrio phage vB_VibM_10AMN]|uniref:Uncharacterized protein n=1 Tax=Staphylococcus phage vB_VibM_10AMN12 TaxID=3076785 RepID=A0AA96KSQ5_9CAUD|nr:hypothetical protein [Vibrio phage vB_VibM_10AMN]WNO47465.1 hypothetical protein [Staphylococcus phage vB_VibM_10AMN12]